MESNQIRVLLLHAIKLGYRHFDCAADYQNESEVGDALSPAFQSGLVKREDLVIPPSLKKLDIAYSKVKPAVNQIETHPYFQRDSLVKFCQKHGIRVTAHTPLGGSVANTEWFGSVSCLDEPVLKGLADKYKKTVAQVVLRWGIQRNTVVIPKSSKLDTLKENIEAFDFELSEEDMGIIKSIDKEYRTNQPAKFWGINHYA